MPRLQRALLPALVLALAATAASAEPVRIEHAQGEAVLPAPARRVAVYDLAALDILQALGAPVAAVPDVRIPAHLAPGAGVDVVRAGTLFEPDLDALAAAEADLVILGGRSRRAYADVQALAPTIDLSAGTRNYLAATYASIDALGRATGRSKAAEAEAMALRARLAELHARTADAGTGLVLFAVGDRAIAHAPGERFGIVHEVLGVPSVLPTTTAAASEGVRPEAGSPEARAQAADRAAALEAALAADPDWLFVIDRDAATGDPERPASERLADHPAVSASRAWRSGRVLHLDAPAWYLATGGIGTLTRTADAFTAALDAAE
ncbi:ABC transporter substrate-binding protein [Coralloluteibacterium stylophorae]|uniref:ABC transporter substrate-binding protein n=1 Tax=Coralloluteibacterium stylophorae TaxID=1776034 RepID=A0A8J8AXJ8_9GAMM|nr:ABC transporter substrate-binding protein [Coralloluteibacterium stylophorae]MBS7458802.1 ABC transporter substrate-binding protein [Coralloluteibacterium stylophorae]